MTTKSEKLREFVLLHLDSFEHSGGSGKVPELPKFELYAQDYLQFAEQELRDFQSEQKEQRKTAHLGLIRK